MMLDNVDRISAQIAASDARITEAIGPFSRQVDQLTDITGIDTVAAAELIAEIGVEMTRFPSAANPPSGGGTVTTTLYDPGSMIASRRWGFRICTCFN